MIDILDRVFKIDCGIRHPWNDFQPAISYGSKIAHSEFPWHVALYKQNSANENVLYICGGTILHPRVILTAAHCLYSEDYFQIENATFTVVAGKYDVSWEHTDPGEQRLKVVDIKFPNTFIGYRNRYADDIALLELNTTIKFNSAIMPVCIDWSLEYLIDLPTVGTVVGWGWTENDTLSNELRGANLKVTEFAECRARISKHFSDFITSDKFCAGLDNGTSVQLGDSGGGLTFPQNTKDYKVKYYLFGIVSIKQTTQDAIATFTDIRKHYHWLNTALLSMMVQCKEVSSNTMNLECFHGNSKVDCGRPMLEGTELRAKCKDAYRPEDPSKAFNKTHCLSNGSWVNELYKCVPVQCKGVYSNEMDLECFHGNSKVDCGQPMLVGTELRAKCKYTYQPEDPSKAFHKTQCLPNGSWGNELYKCVPVQCKGVSSNEMDLECFHGNSKVDCGQPMLVGTELRAKCKYTYQPEDPSKAFHKTQCLPNGSWGNELYKCVPVQCKGVSSNEMDLECFYGNSKVDCGQPMLVGTELRAKCKYTYQPEDPSRVFHKTQCLPNGSWSNELYKCVPVTCHGYTSTAKDLKCFYYNSEVDCGHPVRVGTVLKAKCKDTHQPEDPLKNHHQTECLSSGSWSMDIRIHKCIPIKCHGYTSTAKDLKCFYQNSEVDCGHPVRVGTVLKAKCKDTHRPEDPLINLHQTECLPSGSWSMDIRIHRCIPNKVCPGYTSTAKDLKCFYKNSKVSCRYPVRVGTVLKAKCKDTHRPLNPFINLHQTKCLSSGRWSMDIRIHKCILKKKHFF
nr:limulus clotting factor C [Halyomorpha halys]